jgi:hypothetical protein
MAEVSKELIYRSLLQISGGLVAVGDKMDDINRQLHALEMHTLAVRQDVRNIRTILERHDARLDRIERRLDITEVIS